MNEIFDCKKIVDNFKVSSTETSKLKIVIIQVHDDPVGQYYTDEKVKACKEYGIEVEVIKVDVILNYTKLYELIDKLNNDDSVTGISIQLPLPLRMDETALINRIRPSKDVDCLTARNRGLIGHRDVEPIFYPPMAIACSEVVFNVHYKGTYDKDLVILGESETLAKPLVRMLSGLFRNVTICSGSIDQSKLFIEMADVIIVDRSSPNSIMPSLIKEGATLIDASLNLDENNNIVSAVNINSALSKVKAITNINNGLNLIYRIMFVYNCIRAPKYIAGYRSRERWRIKYDDFENDADEYKSYEIADRNKSKSANEDTNILSKMNKMV